MIEFLLILNGGIEGNVGIITEIQLLLVGFKMSGNSCFSVQALGETCPILGGIIIMAFFLSL